MDETSQKKQENKEKKKRGEKDREEATEQVKQKVKKKLKTSPRSVGSLECRRLRERKLRLRKPSYKHHRKLLNYYNTVFDI